MSNNISNEHRRRFLHRVAVGAASAAGASLILPRGLSGEDKKVVAASDLKILSEDPPNAEPRLGPLVDSWITPIERFYVRSHAVAPKIDPAAFRLKIEGLVDRPFEISLAELKDRFEAVKATATLTCAGNRRTEHSAVKPVKGVQWGAGAIGNARWQGVALAEVLKKAGVQDGAKHVWFEGLDRVEHDGGVIGFGGSIPIERAMNRKAGATALLANEMNGEPLTADHGFPLRTLVPGYIGARSVKWIGRIVVSDRPSPNHYLAGAYKVVVEGTDDEWKSASPIYDFVINSVICRPAAAAMLKSGKTAVLGYALPSGNAAIVEGVQVSADEGKSWTAAEITSKTSPYCWALWRADVRIGDGTKALMVRTRDSSGTVQPARVDWNLKGYLFNAWHRVPVSVS